MKFLYPLLLLCTVFIIGSCSKGPDYRDPYVGTYEFTKKHSSYGGHYEYTGPMGSAVWVSTSDETIDWVTTGEIIKSKWRSDEVIIKYGSGSGSSRVKAKISADGSLNCINDDYCENMTYSPGGNWHTDGTNYFIDLGGTSTYGSATAAEIRGIKN